MGEGGGKIVYRFIKMYAVLHIQVGEGGREMVHGVPVKKAIEDSKVREGGGEVFQWYGLGWGSQIKVC
jgi:hypothetical protein